MRLCLLLLSFTFLLKAPAHLLFGAEEDNICRADAEHTSHDYDLDSTKKIPRTLEIRAKQILPPGMCKRVKNNQLRCFNGRRKCSDNTIVCANRAGFPCDCDYDPYISIGRHPPIRPIPPGKCRAVRTGKLFCFYDQRKCSNDASICIGRLGLKCECGQNPYPDWWLHVHRRNEEEEAIDDRFEALQKIDTSATSDCIDVYPPDPPLNAACKPELEEKEASTDIIRATKSVQMERRAILRGHCRERGPGIFDCYSGGRVCSVNRGVCTEAWMPCDCEFDPFEDQLAANKRALESIRVEKTLSAAKAAAAGKQPTALQGFCRNSRKGVYWCYHHRLKCADEPCIVPETICPCDHDPYQPTKKRKERAKQSADEARPKQRFKQVADQSQSPRHPKRSVDGEVQNTSFSP